MLYQTKEKKSPCLRTPKEIMESTSLGAFHSSYISFSRSLIRTLIHEKWKISQTLFNLDNKGFGNVVYKIVTPQGLYHAIFLTQYLDSSLRNDRVIANQWDLTCALWNNKISKAEIDSLAQNLPLQEKGRYSPKVISISRANKSMRLFEYVTNCLAEGKQPNPHELKQIGYLVRTTAVYGNGKFGMADYLNLLDSDFAHQFRAQMLTVYLVRQFTLDWIQYLAKCKNPQKAIPLSSSISQFMGVGNSTGLGMVPFLVKHPQVIHSWVKQREQALYEIIYQTTVNKKNWTDSLEYITKGIHYFKEFKIPDKIQRKKNELLVIDLEKLFSYLRKIKTVSDSLWEKTWEHINDKTSDYSGEVKELFLNILMEIYPNLSKKYENFFYTPEPIPIIGNIKISDIIQAIEKNFSWAINLNYQKKENNYFFWYRSEEKAEPRLGKRYLEPGAEKEIKIDIGRSIKKLYDKLQTYQVEKKSQTVGEFLLKYPNFSGEIKRVVIYEKYPYGEIKKNILSKEFYAIDILRLKLSFFGAVKFDPKSDRWLRITLFQGAPLLTLDGYIQPNDNWFLYRYEDSL